MTLRVTITLAASTLLWPAVTFAETPPLPRAPLPSAPVSTESAEPRNASPQVVAPAPRDTPSAEAALPNTSVNTPPTLPPTPPPAAEPVTVLVTAEQRRELGSIYVPRHEARLVPGAFADPFRVIEVMPGVAPILSGIPYFYVRGAPPGNVGYFIDGIRVPLLFHVGAGPSVIAPALVDHVELFSAAYPARHGRYSGAIMAGETTEPAEWAHGEARARVFDAGAIAQTLDGRRRYSTSFRPWRAPLAVVLAPGANENHRRAIKAAELLAGSPGCAPRRTAA